jgi:hypothetical protein
MDKLTAFKLVLELAEQNALSDRECDTSELVRERVRQLSAIAHVRRHINRMEKAK